MPRSMLELIRCPSMNKQAEPSAGAANPLAQPWVMIAGATLGGIVLFFFMALVLLGIGGHEVPCTSTYLVNITLSLGAALAAGFLGGNASARGSIPFLKSSPMTFGVSGGIGTLVVVLVISSNLFGRGNCGTSMSVSCPPGSQSYVVDILRFGFCYPREGWEVDAGAIGINAADIYVRKSGNRDIGVQLHVSLIPASWANRPIEYSAEVAKTWRQLDSALVQSRTFVGGRDAYVFSLHVKDRAGRSRPTEVTHIYLDPERLIEAIATWFEDTPQSIRDDLGKMKSSLTFPRV